MMVLGIIIAAGAAIAFLSFGLLAVFAGARATQHQVIPGFVPDGPSTTERVLTLLSIWGAIAFVAALCVLVALRLFEMIMAVL